MPKFDLRVDLKISVLASKQFQVNAETKKIAMAAARLLASEETNFVDLVSFNCNCTMIPFSKA